MLFRDTCDHVCLSSYYKNESEENGGRIYFLRLFRSFRFADAGVNLFVITKVRIPAVFATKSTYTLQWDRRRYHLPGEER